MTSSEKAFDTIEQYLRGDLSKIDRDSFEAKMVADVELANEVAAHRLTDELVVDYNILKVRGEMSAWQSENDSNPNLFKPVIGLSIFAALLIIGAIVLRSEEPTTQSHLKLPSPFEKNESIIPKENDEPIQVTQKDKEASYQTNKLPLPVGVTDPDKHRFSALEQIPSLQRRNPNISTPPIAIPKLEIPLLEKNDCREILPLDFVQYQGSCEGTKKGFIEFSAGSLNGENPLAFSIDNGLTFQKSRNFSFLENGTYQAMLMISSGCVFEYDHVIVLTPTNTGCENIIINTVQNQYWEPMINLKNAKIQIINSYGALVFSSPLDNRFKWYGHNKNGEQLPMGNYFFIVESLGKLIQSGSITILR